MYKKIIKGYLESRYEGWNEEKLYYKKVDYEDRKTDD